MNLSSVSVPGSPLVPPVPAPTPDGQTGTQGREGVALIAAERQRQIDVEGYTPDHDRGHRHGGLVDAAHAYLDAPRFTDFPDFPPPQWPWARSNWKPTPDDRVRELAKAGALIAAEIDRIQAGSS